LRNTPNLIIPIINNKLYDLNSSQAYLNVFHHEVQ